MPIPNTKRKYWASTLGRVRSENKLLRNKITRHGYNTVSIKYGNIFKEKKVHRLVAESFFKHYTELLQVNHIDGVKTNNFLTNLEMVTPLENMRHAIRIGLISQNGEDNPSSVLNEKQVLEIRKLFKNGLSKNKLSKMYGVSRRTIRVITERLGWTHI